MNKRVFFSFHYRRDAWRAHVVRNSWVTKPDREDAGFMDSTERKKIETEGEDAMKQWIDQELEGTAVTVLLIGAETAGEKWVRYELQKSLERGNGILGIYIHKIEDENGKTIDKGATDFGKIDGKHDFSEVYPIYDWINDKGYENLGDWVDIAYSWSPIGMNQCAGYCYNCT